MYGEKEKRRFQNVRMKNHLIVWKNIEPLLKWSPWSCPGCLGESFEILDKQSCFFLRKKNARHRHNQSIKVFLYFSDNFFFWWENTRENNGSMFNADGAFVTDKISLTRTQRVDVLAV